MVLVCPNYYCSCTFYVTIRKFTPHKALNHWPYINLQHGVTIQRCLISLSHQISMKNYADSNHYGSTVKWWRAGANPITSMPMHVKCCAGRLVCHSASTDAKPPSTGSAEVELVPVNWRRWC